MIDQRPGEINRGLRGLEATGEIKAFAIEARGDRPPRYIIWAPALHTPPEGLKLTVREAAVFLLGRSLATQARVGFLDG